jgi:hypothetical protein
LQKGGLDFESHQCFVTFKQTQVKLAWTFLCTMNVVQYSKTLHNDLSHFMLNNLSVVYIGLCD